MFREHVAFITWDIKKIDYSVNMRHINVNAKIIQANKKKTRQQGNKIYYSDREQLRYGFKSCASWGAAVPIIPMFRHAGSNQANSTNFGQVVLKFMKFGRFFLLSITRHTRDYDSLHPE